MGVSENGRNGLTVREMGRAISLSVNIDHVATVRNARNDVDYCDILDAARVSMENGASSVTMHLREDRRHVRDGDVRLIAENGIPLCFEMAATDEMVGIALEVLPQCCCIVPEKREELTTEGGLDVKKNKDWLGEVASRLIGGGIEVSFFVDAVVESVDLAAECGATVVEINTGLYATLLARGEDEGASLELEKILKCAQYAAGLGIKVAGGHGLNYSNIVPLRDSGFFVSFSVGHFLVTRALFCGLGESVGKMCSVLRVWDFGEREISGV